MMDQKERMKWFGTILFTLFGICVIVIAVCVSRKANHVTADADRGVKEGELDGWVENAYIVGGTSDTVTVWYEGQEYTLQGMLADKYCGIADLEVSQGQLLQVAAKQESIQGTLDSYSENSVQISGYEVLSYSGELPVYMLSSDAEEAADVPVGQKKLTDLVVGTSKVQLVVAEGAACAILQYQEDCYENIRVLIKNGKGITYDNVYITSDHTYTVDGATKKKVVSAKSLLKGCKDGEEIRIQPGDGLLYISNRDGDYVGDGYEGDFLVRRTEKGYVLVNEVPIETYVRYVLPSEMPTYFAYEALKAQAVCARTFAYKQMQTNAYAAYGANLDDSTSYQVYHASGTYEITDQAVRDTEGLVVTFEGELIDCYYYSTSPGYSENMEVWNTVSPDYLLAENHTRERAVDLSDAKRYHKFISEPVDSYDIESPYYRWSATLSAKLGMDEEFGRLKKLKINERSAYGYILSMTMVFEDGERTYEKENDIRFALGKYVSSITLSDGTVRKDFSSVPSACFEVVSQKKGTIELRGGGFGHGLGMSQYGANGLGQDGKSWQEILAFYYKDTEVLQLQ